MERKKVVRYSEGFINAVIADVESTGISFNEAAGKYGIGGGCTIQKWIRKKGRTDLLPTMIYRSVIETK